MKGFCREIEGKPQYRVVLFPANTGKTHEYHLPAGVRVLDHEMALIGGRPFIKLVLDISKESGPQLPDMPKDWDFRDMMKAKL